MKSRVPKGRSVIAGVLVGLLLAALVIGVLALASVSSVQNQLLVSQKASTQTRVKTVEQRCHLTFLILGVLVRVRDQVDAQPFRKSLRTCESQLALVKRINAHTPGPKYHSK